MLFVTHSAYARSSAFALHVTKSPSVQSRISQRSDVL